MQIKLPQQLLLLGLLSLGMSACDNTSTEKKPESDAPPTQITAPTPIPAPTKPIRLPGLTIPPYTLEGDTPPTGVTATEPIPADLRLQYYSTTNTSYMDISVEYGELRYTYFPDLQGRCLKWKQKDPCWNKDELETLAKPLQQEDLDNLAELVLETHLLFLNKDEYGADKKRRKDREFYSVFLNNEMRSYTYYNAPLADPKPEPLARMETALIQYARDLEAETYYPNPDAVPLQPAQPGAD